jgi:predicted small metal-binding protein
MTKKLICDANGCEFEVQAATVNEAVRYLEQHTAACHNTDLTRIDIEKMVEYP